MSQQGNSVNGNQSLVGEGASEAVLEDLSVQNAEMIKGGPTAGKGGGADIIVFDIIDS